LLDPQGLRHCGREHGRAIPLGDIHPCLCHAHEHSFVAWSGCGLRQSKTIEGVLRAASVVFHCIQTILLQ
jgi:hypothetical protein